MDVAVEMQVVKEMVVAIETTLILVVAVNVMVVEMKFLTESRIVETQFAAEAHFVVAM